MTERLARNPGVQEEMFSDQTHIIEAPPADRIFRGEVNLIIDKMRCREYLEKHVNAVHNKQGIHGLGLTPPDAIVPENMEPGSPEHRNFLILSCSIDGRTQSEALYANMRRLFQEFSFAEMTKWDEGMFIEMSARYLKQAEPRTPWILQSAVHWIKAQGKNLGANLKSMRTAEQVKDYLRDIWGVGPGRATLAAKNLERFEYTQLNNPFELPIKVDRHLIRQALGTGFIQAYSKRSPHQYVVIRHNQLEGLIAQVALNMTVKHMIPPIPACDGKYMTGTRVCLYESLDACTQLCYQDCSMKVRSQRGTSEYLYPSDVRTARGKYRRKDVKPGIQIPLL